MRDSRAAQPALVALALVVLLALAGCGQSHAPRGPVTPKLRPPAIAKPGILRIAVDAHYPPFASYEGKQLVGIDADVAAALCAQLGLTPEFVDVPADKLGSALREKRVDIALGGVPITEAALSEVSVATSYLGDAPALFSKNASVTPEELGSLRIAVQKESASYWLLRARVAEDHLIVLPTLREALAAAAAGKADAAAGDAVVAGYIRHEFPALVFAGQLNEAAPLALTVAKDADVIEPVVREAMDELAATGVLDAIRGKWLGDMPALWVPSSAEETAAAEATPSPDVQPQ